MRAPLNYERILCPDGSSEQSYSPVKVWDSVLPDGTKVRYGTVGKHAHVLWGAACEYEGLALPVVEVK